MTENEKVPEGWVLVPREATEAMLKAAHKAQGSYLKKLADSMGDRLAEVPDLCAETYRAQIAAAPAPAEAKAGENVTDEMVKRFLTWPLPDSVCPDRATNDPARLSGKYRELTGTNLLTADEARAMLVYVLQAKPADAGEVDVDCKARQLLAAEYLTKLGPAAAKDVRNGPWTVREDAALRAIKAALRGVRDGRR